MTIYLNQINISFNFWKQIKIVTIDKLTITTVSFITIQKVFYCWATIIDLTTTIPMNNISNIFYCNVRLNKILFL